MCIVYHGSVIQLSISFENKFYVVHKYFHPFQLKCFNEKTFILSFDTMKVHYSLLAALISSTLQHCIILSGMHFISIQTTNLIQINSTSFTQLLTRIREDISSPEKMLKWTFLLLWLFHYTSFNLVTSLSSCSDSVTKLQVVYFCSGTKKG